MAVLTSNELSEVAELVESLSGLVGGNLAYVSLGDVEIFDSNGDKLGAIDAHAGQFISG